MSRDVIVVVSLFTASMVLVHLFYRHYRLERYWYDRLMVVLLDILWVVVLACVVLFARAPGAG